MSVRLRVCTEARYASTQRRFLEYLHGPHDRLIDPGLASEPVVIGATDWASGKTQTLRRKASRSDLILVGIAQPVCGHLTMIILMRASLGNYSLSNEREPAGRSASSSQCGLLGGIAHRESLFEQGGLLVTTFSDRPDSA